MEKGDVDRIMDDIKHKLNKKMQIDKGAEQIRDEEARNKFKKA